MPQKSKDRNPAPDWQRTAGFVLFGWMPADVTARLGNLPGLDLSWLDGEDFFATVSATPPDLLVFCPEEDQNRPRAFAGCARLRDAGYQGVILLLIDSAATPFSTSEVTAAGFDAHIPAGGGVDGWHDAVALGVINRRRRNKYTLQFDGNPDDFCIIDREARVVEINQAAASGSGLRPREIVRRGVKGSHIVALQHSVRLALPLLDRANIGSIKVFTFTEGQAVFQLQVGIHEAPTLGLVAVLRRTDITGTIYARSLDILLNSVRMLSERDQYTAGHSARVVYYCMRLADTLERGANRRFKVELFHAALLHDIGKVGVRDSILLKPGKLDSDEFRSLCTHPVKAFKILRHFEFLRESLEFIRHHHERPDGKGYPDKLRGNRIPLGALIIGVADGFDAMTTNRPYRKSLGFEAAIREITVHRGTQFDQIVAEAFLSQMTVAVHQEVSLLARRPLEVTAKEVFERL